MEEKGLKLAFCLIFVEVDKDKKKVENGKSELILMDTLDSIGVDYSEDIKRVHWQESNLYDDLIDLMQDDKVQIKVIKALMNKGLITKENVYRVDLSLMIGEFSDKGISEGGDSGVNANSDVDMYAIVGADKPQWVIDREKENDLTNDVFILDEEVK